MTGRIMNLSEIVDRLGHESGFLTCRISAEGVHLFDSAGKAVEGVRAISVNQQMPTSRPTVTVVLMVRFEDVPS